MEKAVPVPMSFTRGNAVAMSTREGRFLGIVTGLCPCGCGMVEVMWLGTRHTSRVQPGWLKPVALHSDH